MIVYICTIRHNYVPAILLSPYRDLDPGLASNLEAGGQRWRTVRLEHITLLKIGASTILYHVNHHSYYQSGEAIVVVGVIVIGS